jgi:hypothetical protein
MAHRYSYRSTDGRWVLPCACPSRDRPSAGWAQSGYGSSLTRHASLILVWDANPQPPIRIDPDSEAESGRGLLLVEAISERWDWYVPPDGTGKVVWCLATR